MCPSRSNECMIPQCEDERRMRNEGLCIVQRGPGVHGTRAPGISSETHTCVEDGRGASAPITHTPEGDLTEVREPAGFTSWTVEFMFKGPRTTTGSSLSPTRTSSTSRPRLSRASVR